MKTMCGPVQAACTENVTSPAWTSRAISILSSLPCFMPGAGCRPAAGSGPLEVVGELPVGDPVRRDLGVLGQPVLVGLRLVEFHGGEVLDERRPEQVLGHGRGPECGHAV